MFNNNNKSKHKVVEKEDTKRVREDFEREKEIFKNIIEKNEEEKNCLAGLPLRIWSVTSILMRETSRCPNLQQTCKSV